MPLNWGAVGECTLKWPWLGRLFVDRPRRTRGRLCFLCQAARWSISSWTRRYASNRLDLLVAMKLRICSSGSLRRVAGEPSRDGQERHGTRNHVPRARLRTLPLARNSFGLGVTRPPADIDGNPFPRCPRGDSARVSWLWAAVALRRLECRWSRPSSIGRSIQVTLAVVRVAVLNAQGTIRSASSPSTRTSA